MIPTCASWCGGRYADVMPTIVETKARWWAKPVGGSAEFSVHCFCSQKCYDAGRPQNPSGDLCPTCRGAKKILHFYRRGPGDAPGNGMGTCPTCQGRGEVPTLSMQVKKVARDVIDTLGLYGGQCGKGLIQPCPWEDACVLHRLAALAGIVESAKPEENAQPSASHAAPVAVVCPIWCGDLASNPRRRSNCILSSLADGRLHAFCSMECLFRYKPDLKEYLERSQTSEQSVARKVPGPYSGT